MAEVKKAKIKKEAVKVEEEILEELEDELEEDTLFEGGPTEEEIEDMKIKAGGKLNLTRIGESMFIWRPLKRQEYKQIMSIQGIDNYSIEERVCERCTLWPQDKNIFRNGDAGYANALMDEIYMASGFTRDVVTIKL